jgi:hypothetical protein
VYGIVSAFPSSPTLEDCFLGGTMLIAFVHRRQDRVLVLRQDGLAGERRAARSRHAVSVADAAKGMRVNLSNGVPVECTLKSRLRN